MAITKEKILEEIQKSGFPSELKIANIFSKDGWEIESNNYYIDRDEQKGREIDLICKFQKTTETTEEEYLELIFSMIVEIKSSKNPWIFFSSPTTRFEKSVHPPFISNFINFSEDLEQTLRGKIYNLSNKLGRSFYSIGQNQIFPALCSVAKATEHAFESNFLHKGETNGIPTGYKLMYAYEPVIIFDGELFEAFLNSKEEIEVQESNYIQVSFNYLSPNYKNRKFGYIIHLVKCGYLKDFLEHTKKRYLEISEKLRKREMPHFNFR